MEKINQNSKVPLYLQLVKDIKTRITTNKLRPGDKIESEDELCKKYGISRVTVRKALQQLCDEEILIKKHGKGTYVSTPSLIEDVTLSESFSGYCALNNLVASTKVISCKVVTSTTEIASKLGIKNCDTVIELQRVRMINGHPALFEKDYFRSSDQYILDVDFEVESLLAVVMNNSNLDVHAFSDEISVELGDDEINYEMKVDESHHYLLVNELVLSVADEIVYFNKQYINTEIYKYKTKSYRGV